MRNHSFVFIRAGSLIFLILLLSGCLRDSNDTFRIPLVHKLVYKVDIQQGNVVTQDMLARLRPGMDKSQVSFIMGTPLLVDSFHSDRWDYYYSYEKGGGGREQRSVCLIFADDKLVAVEGDVTPATGALKPSENTETMVIVPNLPRREGLVAGLLRTLGLSDTNVPPPTEAEHQAAEAALPEHEKAILEKGQVDTEESEPAAPIIPGAEGPK
ncbi:MAG: outer membrane protein assembly factor BamE [Gammaproteobacteria bacterium]|nr:outer membrane protein assembly factor BamE [Gammaproteobacteria bacterium]MCI0591370.1 outer membrane protein assembly factor BamE [Gammaproteobacteria bacterium]